MGKDMVREGCSSTTKNSILVNGKKIRSVVKATTSTGTIPGTRESSEIQRRRGRGLCFYSKMMSSAGPSSTIIDTVKGFM